MGEGAGALVLEAEEHALARGARIYGELAGTSVTADAYHITAPDPQGLGATRALKAAMFDGRIQAEDVVHVNAHATSTPVGDKPEYTALRAALGTHVDNVAVSATKSQMGHLLGASGAVEAVLTVLAVYERRAPVTINLENQDPEIPLDVVTSPRDPARRQHRGAEQLLRLRRPQRRGRDPQRLVRRPRWPVHKREAPPLAGPPFLLWRFRAGTADGGQPTWCSQRTGAPSAACRKGSSSSSQASPKARDSSW